MNKKLLIGIIVLAILGTGVYFYKSGTGTTGDNNVTSGIQSIKDLMASGVPQKCTFSTSDESGTSEGTTYVSGGSVRADFSTTIDGETSVSHMITDGKTSYVWEDGKPTGFKMVTPEYEEGFGSEDSEGTSEDEGVDLDQNADYVCAPWIPDNSFFEPPGDVDFTDFSKMYALPASSGAADQNFSQCSYCDALSGSDKLQCLTAFNCN
jgi:hypothetical protein